MKCKFCNRSFKKEETILHHICEKKRRWQQKDDHIVKVGFMTWLKFMENIKTRKKNLTYEDFMNSKLYNQFIKFANHIHQLEAIQPENYINYLLNNNIKLKDWTKDYVYESYMAEFFAKETPNEGIERSIQCIEKWADDNNQNLENFFENVSTYKFTYWIITGKISPWFIFCAKNSNLVMNRLNNEQHELINKYIERAKWKLKIKKYESEFKKLSKILEEYGI